MNARHLASTLITLVALSVHQPPAMAQQGGLEIKVSPRCGNDLHNGFGPFDYRLYANTQASKSDTSNPLYLVQRAHFRPEMEALIEGGQGPKSAVSGEFDYTLRAFPNHHRALMALMRLADRERSEQPQKMRYQVDCYFERATAWRPDDVMVRLLFAKYLVDRKRAADARKQLGFASALAKDSPLTQHNVGMLYFDIQDYGPALEHAHKAMALGMERPALRERLVQAGRWQEPAAPEAASAPLAAPASAPAASAASAPASKP